MTLEDLAGMIRNFGGMNTPHQYPPQGTPVQQGIAGAPWESLLGLAGLNSKPQPGVTYGMMPTGPKGMPQLHEDPVKQMQMESEMPSRTQQDWLNYLNKTSPAKMFGAAEGDMPMSREMLIRKGLIEGHSIPTKWVNNRLLAADDTIYKGDTKPTRTWKDVTEMKHNDVLKWLGY